MEYIVKKYIGEIEHSELDFVNQDILFGKQDDYVDYETIEEVPAHTYYNGEAVPMEIDSVIKQLQEIKEKGANFVEIDFHCDHIGYNFNGLEMRLATEEEISEHIGVQQVEIDKQKQQEINLLEKKLKQLKEK